MRGIVNYFAHKRLKMPQILRGIARVGYYPYSRFGDEKCSCKTRLNLSERVQI